jgi:hypothetical protein
MQYLLDLNVGLPGTGPDIGGNRILHISVDAFFEGVAVEDEGVAGLYRAEVPADLEDHLAAACALGAFHSNFVVNWPDSFTFTVFDDETGEELKPDMVVDWIELGRSCIDIEFLGNDD